MRFTVLWWRRRESTPIRGPRVDDAGSSKAPDTPPATDRWDEHGVPTSQYCDGGTDFVKYFVDRGMPRIWYRCALPQTTDCLKDRSINCSADFTRILPIWETHDRRARAGPVPRG